MPENRPGAPPSGIEEFEFDMQNEVEDAYPAKFKQSPPEPAKPELDDNDFVSVADGPQEASRQPQGSGAEVQDLALLPAAQSAVLAFHKSIESRPSESRDSIRRTSAMVRFERRIDGRNFPLRVPKRFIVARKAHRNGFAMCKPGTLVSADRSIYLNGELAVKMASCGEIVDDEAEAEEADEEPPPGEEDSDDFEAASYFVRLERCKDGKRRWHPSRLQVLGGQVIQFSWRVECAQGIALQETDRRFTTELFGTRLGGGGDCRHCNFKAPECPTKIYFRCSAFHEATVSVQVMSRWQQSVTSTAVKLTKLFLPLSTIAALTYLLIQLFSTSGYLEVIFNCRGMDQYCKKVLELERFFLRTAGVPLVFGLMLVALGVPATLVSAVWPRPTLRSFGCGFDEEAVQQVRALSSCFLLLSITVLCADWGMNIRYSSGLSDLLIPLGEFSSSLLDTASSVLSDAVVLLRVADALDASVDASVLDIGFDYEAQVRVYAQLGVDLLATLVSMRLIIHFLVMMLAVVALAYGAAGLFRRSARALHFSSWLSLVALTFLLWVLAFNYFMHELWLDTFETYKYGPTGRNSLSVELFSFCADDEHFRLPYDEIVRPFNATLSQIREISCAEGHCISLARPPATAADLHVFLDEVSKEAHTLAYWLDRPDTDMRGILALGPNSQLSAAELADALRAGVRVVDAISDLINCRQIGPFLDTLERRLDGNIVPTGRAVVFTEECLAVCLAVWAALAARNRHMFLRPLKFYQDPVSGRWFRFKFSYLVSVRLRKATVGNQYYPHRVKRHCCNSFELLQQLLLTNTVLVFFLLVCSFLLLFLERGFNPAQTWVDAGAVMLMVSSLVALGGGVRKLHALRNRLLRLAGVLLVAMAFGCILSASAENHRRAHECWEKVGYRPGTAGPIGSSAFKRARASIQANWTLNVTGEGLQAGDLMMAVRNQEVCPPEGSELAYSKPAGPFGREYEFDEALPAGFYALCWCSGAGDCSTPSSFTKFSGHLYVDEPADVFKTCSLELFASMTGIAGVLGLLLPFLVAQMVLGLSSVFRAVYSAHITDKQQRILLAASSASRSRSFKAVFTGRSRQLWALAVGTLALLVAEVTTIALMARGNSASCYAITGCDDPQPGAPPMAPPEEKSCSTCCNLQVEVCDLPVDRAAFATVHNAMSSEQDRWLFPNNMLELGPALRAGMRGLMIDVWYKYPDNATSSELEGPGEPFMCHGICAIGQKPLVQGLAEIRDFLAENPQELVVLILEQYVATTSIMDAFDATGLTRFCTYGHSSSASAWPTVGELLRRGAQVLVFSNRPSGYTGKNAGGDAIGTQDLGSDWAQKVSSLAWWHYDREFLTSTAYTYPSLPAMEGDCELSKIHPISDLSTMSQQSGGGESHRLIVVNHFISNPLPCESCAAEANAEKFFWPRMRDCSSQWQHQANFPTVDFWSLGDALEVAKSLNEMEPRVGE